MTSYNPLRAASWNYGGKNWKLSRSKIELFQECPRCFYLDNKLGTKRPPGPPFNINKAVDNQLKNEFDTYRVAGDKHPLQVDFNIDAKPVVHPMLDEWRENFNGIQVTHKPTSMIISGAIDDLWINSKSEYIVVDYKATAKAEPVTSLDSEWQNQYKRQLEIYQWLLRQTGLKVSNTAYIVYCTGKFDQPRFDKTIEFDIHIIEHVGDDVWVEPIITRIKECLESDKIPDRGGSCEFCQYRAAAEKKLKQRKIKEVEIPEEFMERIPRKLKIEWADKEADENCRKKWPDQVEQLGWCHIVWGEKKRILKEKYGIKWKTPAEKNPDTIYD